MIKAQWSIFFLLSRSYFFLLFSVRPFCSLQLHVVLYRPKKSPKPSKNRQIQKIFGPLGTIWRNDFALDSKQSKAIISSLFSSSSTPPKNLLSTEKNYSLNYEKKFMSAKTVSEANHREFRVICVHLLFPSFSLLLSL